MRHMTIQIKELCNPKKQLYLEEDEQEKFLNARHKRVNMNMTKPKKTTLATSPFQLPRSYRGS